MHKKRVEVPPSIDSLRLSGAEILFSVEPILKIHNESGESVVPVVPFIGRQKSKTGKSEIGIGVILQESDVLFQGGEIVDALTLWRSVQLLSCMPEVNSTILLACYLGGDARTPFANVRFAHAFITHGGYSYFNGKRAEILKKHPEESFLRRMEQLLAAAKPS